MNRLLTSLCLTGCLVATNNLTFTNPIAPRFSPPPANAQTSSELFYTFYGQRIPLSQRQNTIAVAFKPDAPRTRGGLPLHLQLQQDLAAPNSGNTRGGNTPSSAPAINVEVNSLGDRYALITLPTDTSSSDANLTQRLSQQPYVESVLPVLARQSRQDGKSTVRNETIVLPNQILISTEPKLSGSQLQLLLNQNNLEIIRPLRFTKNRYLVRAKKATGTEILALSNRLNQVQGIQSATPNFIQSLPYIKQELATQQTTANLPNALERIQALLQKLPPIPNTPFSSNKLPLQWHLNSTSQRGTIMPRTDIRATEAWQHSQRGKGTVVAVIDSLIQWDHPDLVDNIYRLPDSSDRLPGEVNGWDFANNDPDTRISDSEMNQLGPHFQNTFQLSTPEILKKYEGFANDLKERYPKASPDEIANRIRNYIRDDIASEFHGTWSAGVIAAHPKTANGVAGVAPEAKILPVRVFGVGGELEGANLVEAIGYAAERKVDVINMSLGGLLPDQELTAQVFDVLDSNPNLVIVASAGNESLDGVAFPAAIPGVVAVGATNFTGNRSFYSSFGGRLDIVAPGGDTSQTNQFGILTTGGTGTAAFWQGTTPPNYSWGVALDPKGEYVQVQGTSFSAPTVSGVVALMQRGEPQRKLQRDRLVKILQQSASYEALNLTKADENQYRLQAAIGFGTAQDFPFLRPSGIFPQPKPVSAQQYFFGKGLVNAEAAVIAAQ
jgi:serine protease